ncbi:MULTISPECIES: cbb3-type cytochrome oxidase assembly protein CcoS [Endozoicomonas]|uniref:cbb3-type cytochrome oxidase assembly protein CcoS n=1 Tax=Endozoicomonas TaxID=305899 RepID=UPI0013D51558|nr:MULTISPECIES: cbb3-type cytochrome oxidase assembly protein CcoS [Endozoicomonas]WBA80287.1 cbb3-type cytochrome oxidase assembly protein CcoS [Endozoicomonas sp. GU-1]WBA87856.1 cbb3-type cytochrome oxidase assembly protein CcoS [Endozoicomonas sp. GU-1]
MESLIILIPLALILIAVAIKLFFWAVDDGQFDDLEGPAHSILFDEPQQIAKANAHDHK